MTHAIARLFKPLLRLMWPAQGRHRSANTRLAAPNGDASTTRPHAPHPVLRGEDVVLIRPYLVAHEQRMETQRQQARRRALWLAVHGIDVGPRLIHGVEVTA
ncbi:hypothetical protein OG735_26350 [Streptomyces sp. NBC_01210]|uniref:hypothetical protein n=1 Tax=Streptomyces sp. NBC_01210 TaxID=2903774 RepID=UPI002E0E970B|nr:hypothetical protein OG735_26350 [Streptomyces sp. NBC_01210]